MQKNEFINYLYENSDLLPTKKDKNPLYYMFVTAKLKSGKREDELESDYDLKGIFSRLDSFCKKLGSDNIKLLIKAYKPINIIIKFEEGGKVVNNCKKILTELRNCILSYILTFSETYKITKLFEEFEQSKEIQDFYNSLQK